MRTPRRALAALASLMLGSALLSGACARERFRPEHLPAGRSVIYIYRQATIVSPGLVTIYVNQSPVGRLGRSEYVAAVVDPGDHLVRAERRSDATRLVTLGPGESAFLETGASLLGGLVSLSRQPDDAARERIAPTARSTRRVPEPPK